MNNARNRPVNNARDLTSSAVSGSGLMREVAIFAGAKTVRVHEVRDDLADHAKPYRYVLSVDGAFREADALRNFGWLGDSLGDARRKAERLAREITDCVSGIDGANTHAILRPTLGQHRAKLEKITARYNAVIT